MHGPPENPELRVVFLVVFSASELLPGLLQAGAGQPSPRLVAVYFEAWGFRVQAFGLRAARIKV